MSLWKNEHLIFLLTSRGVKSELERCKPLNFPQNTSTTILGRYRLSYYLSNYAFMRDAALYFPVVFATASQIRL